MRQLLPFPAGAGMNRCRADARRPGTAVLNDDWLQGKRYPTLETMAEISSATEPAPPALPR